VLGFSTDKEANAMKSRRVFSLVVALTGLILASCPSWAGAAQSGEVVAYVSMTERDIAPMQEAFKKATGLDVKVVVIPIGQAATRIKVEAGRPQADVQMGGSIDYYQELAKQDLLIPYESKSAAAIDSKYKDPQHRWTGWYMGVLGLGLNEQAFKKELPGLSYPVSWDDILNPAYKGKYVHANPASSGAAYTFIVGQILRMGSEEKGWDFMRKFTAQVAQYQNTSPGPSNLVATGEYPIGLAWAQDLLVKVDQGYPVKWIAPVDTAYEVAGISILKGAANLENAKIFVDWILTQAEGARMSGFSLRYSTRPDVASPKGVPAFSSLKLVKYDFEWAAANNQRLTKQFSELMRK
jgi:iron(III) transport system substrate-binding protein